MDIDRKKEHIFTWQINNFSMCSKKRNETLCSPNFQTVIFDAVIWCIELYPKGHHNSSSGYVSCFLHRVEEDPCPLGIECEYFIEFMDKNGRSLMCRSKTRFFKKKEFGGFLDYMKREELMKTTLYEDTLIIRCQLCADGPEIAFSQNSAVTTVGSNKLQDSAVVLIDDITRLYLDKILTDVKLKVDKQTFPAHKCILSARSPVFFAMFSQDMAESQRGEVDIPDLDAKTIGLFLEYVYTGLVKDLNYENAIKLIVAADKYQVLSLKNKCAEVLTSMLCDTNVPEVLVTADLVQHDTLKASAFHYIKKQPYKIFKSDEWKHCVESNLELATETVCEVSRLWEEQLKQQLGK